MSALLGKLTILDDMDLVDVDDGAESVGTVDHSLATHDVLKLSHDRLLSVCIQVTRGLIKEEDLCFGLQETTCDQYSLPLSS